MRVTLREKRSITNHQINTMLRHTSLLARRPLLSMRVTLRNTPQVAFSSWQDTVGKKLEEAKPMLSQGALYGGGGVMLFGLTKGTYNIFTGFLSMTPYDMGYYGFIAGFCTAGLLGTSSLAARRAIQIYPNELYNETLSLIRNDTNSCEILGGELGGHIESAGLRAYKIDGGTISVVNRSLQWVPPRCQMIFDVKGELYDALATVEAVKTGGKMTLSFVGLDVMNSKQQRVHVLGDESKHETHHDLRSLLNFKAEHMRP